MERHEEELELFSAWALLRLFLAIIAAFVGAGTFELLDRYVLHLDAWGGFFLWIFSIGFIPGFIARHVFPVLLSPVLLNAFLILESWGDEFSYVDSEFFFATFLLSSVLMVCATGLGSLVAWGYKSWRAR